MEQTIEVIHDKDNHRFYTTVEGDEAYLLYRQLQGNVLEYYSTFVPWKLRGKGLAHEIVRVALQYAENNNYRVEPTCWFVQRVMDKRA
jgi:predicted GNAT family acetyltransferase